MTHVQQTLVPLDLEVVDPDASASDDSTVPEPMFSRFKIGVELGSAKRQLYSKRRVRVLLVDVVTGEVVAGAHGHVQAISFPIYKKDGFEWSERVHKIKCTEDLLLDENDDQEAQQRRRIARKRDQGATRQNPKKTTTAKRNGRRNGNAK